ncbi:hypothetical protein N7478_008772 [Penicillium angulare]|uniref:uncharacterized protein n=1 Tax=Penicillium angulare TaxID=116970 RepID=UPI00253FC3F4|nr:uncharacterized protein N7478_008772 [Penicillium angulare]KAJ5273647.1 hypothetical protein N7478_008772 [Penicillium angulare]
MEFWSGLPSLEHPLRMDILCRSDKVRPIYTPDTVRSSSGPVKGSKYAPPPPPPSPTTSGEGSDSAEQRRIRVAQFLGTVRGDADDLPILLLRGGIRREMRRTLK